MAEDKVEKYQSLALYRAGACEANRKKWPESQKFFETLARDFPRFEQLDDARYGTARAIQEQGRTAEARTIFEQVAKATDGEAAAKSRFMLGEIAFAEHKHEDAIEQYLMVVAGYPYKHWQALAQFEIGRCFLAMGKRQKALEAFQVVVDKHPDHAKAQDAARMLSELKCTFADQSPNSPKAARGN